MRYFSRVVLDHIHDRKWKIKLIQQYHGKWKVLYQIISEKMYETEYSQPSFLTEVTCT